MGEAGGEDSLGVGEWRVGSGWGGRKRTNIR